SSLAGVPLQLDLGPPQRLFIPGGGGGVSGCSVMAAGVLTIAAASVLMIVAAGVLGGAGARFFSRAVFRRARIAARHLGSIEPDYGNAPIGGNHRNESALGRSSIP